MYAYVCSYVLVQLVMLVKLGCMRLCAISAHLYPPILSVRQVEEAVEIARASANAPRRLWFKTQD